MAGDVSISGALAKAPGQTGGDGITGIIFVDGAEVYRQSIGPSDTTGVTYSVDVAVRSGSIIDLAIAPGPSDGADSTTFTARITLLRLRLADSVADHSGVQGHNNWYYGYLSGSFASTTFDPLRQWVPNAHGDGRDLWFLDRSLYRTQLWQNGGHPNKDGGIHWTTRRWISPIAGTLTISGRLAKGDTGGGDGITGRVIVDGVTVFQQFIAGTDGVGVTYSVTPTVTAGSTVDLAIEAGGTENFDSTIFTAVISADADQGALDPETYGLCAHCAFSPDPVNLGTGVFTASAEDLALPGRVLGFAFARWYNSADTTTGPLGPAWTHSYEWRLRESGATVVLRRGDGRRETYLRNTEGTYASPHGVFDTLAKNPDGTFTLTLTSQVAHEFSAAGRLERIHEPAGNQILLSYTGSDLTQITDTVGRVVTLSYDGSGRLVELADPLGRRVTYSYDASGRLATVTDRLGNAAGQDPLLHQWRYSYDGSTQHLVSITDPDGRVRVTNTYDAQGRVFEQRDGEGALTSFAYGTLTTTVTDPRAHATTYTFDSRMRVLSQTDVAGGTTYTISYTYDAVGNRTSVTDRNGNTTDFTYDARGNVLTKTDASPDGVAPRPVTTFEYDARNNLTRIVDTVGGLTTLSYDPSTNALLSVSRQVDATTNATTTYEYTDPANSGLPTRITSPRGNTTGTPDPTFSTTLAYDTQANLIARTDADAATTTFEYDGAGRLVAFVDPDGNAPGGVPAEHRWTVAYDALDRETARTDPLGGTLAYAYDGAGNRTSLSDRNGNVTTYAYDGNARLRTVLQKPDPAGPTVYTTSVTRDANGNATRITQANAVVTDYAFDAFDRLTGVTTYPTPTSPLTTTYVLDGNGQPTSRTTADGVTVTYGYDQLARLVSVTGPALSIGYTYDAAGRRTSMTDATGTTTYQYDGLGRVLGTSTAAGSVGYAYDLDGDRTQLAYPGGDAVTYVYSPGGRLGTVTDWAGRTSTYTYTPSGLVAALAQHGGLSTAYGYDRAQRLTSLEYTQQVAGLPVSALRQAFTLDAEGDRTALDEYVQGITLPPVVWSDSVRVNDDAGTTQQDRPAVAVGSDGATYAVWDDFRSGSHADIHFARRDPSTGQWSANERVNDDATARTQWNAAIAIDGSGTAYAVWQDQREGNKTPDTNIYSSVRVAGGQWAPNLRVNDDTRGSVSQREPRIAAAPGGGAHAVWVDDRSRETNIYSATLAAGASAWSANTRVSNNGASRKRAPDIAWRGDVASEFDGYAVWEDDRSGDFDIYFNVFDCHWPAPDPQLPPPGCSWDTANSKISDDTSGAAQYAPRVVLAANDPVALWLDDRAGAPQVRAKWIAQGTPSVAISDTAAVPVSLAASATAEGRIFVVWQDARGTSYDVWGTEYDPTTETWSAPARLDDDPGASAALRPTVAVGGSAVALAWRDDRSGNADIRARQRTTQGDGLDHFVFGYDGLNRLLSAQATLSPGTTRGETFGYDAATNISTRTGPDATYTVDGANRVTSDGSQSFIWDDADRLVARGADTFAYDALSRLTSATVAGNTTTYTYDGDGLLATRAGGSGTTALLWDASVAPAPLLAVGTDRVVHGLGPLYLARSDGSSIRLARDALGSVRAELDDFGVVSKSFRYAAYGAVSDRFPLGATPTLVSFAGEIADPSGLAYLRARWYDPALGRFMTADSIAGNAGLPASLNLYAYAQGRPTLLVDPQGLSPLQRGSIWSCDLCGRLARDIQWGPGAQMTSVNGVNVVTSAGGIQGFIAGTIGCLQLSCGNMTVTWGSEVIVSTASLDRIRDEILPHEMGHVEQAREMGLAYLPTYVSQALTSPIQLAMLRLSGSPVRSLHDAIPMERDAELRAGHADPWAR